MSASRTRRLLKSFSRFLDSPKRFKEARKYLVSASRTRRLADFFSRPFESPERFEGSEKVTRVGESHMASGGR